MTLTHTTNPTCLHCGTELENARLTDNSSVLVERLGLVLAPVVRADGEILLATVPSFRTHECQREEGKPMEHFTRTNLPDPYEFGEYRKRVPTRMAPIEGPCRVGTKEGAYDLPEGWRGMLALDSSGYPYPIEQGEFEAMYELVAVPE